MDHTMPEAGTAMAQPHPITLEGDHVTSPALHSRRSARLRRGSGRGARSANNAVSSRMENGQSDNADDGATPVRRPKRTRRAGTQARKRKFKPYSQLDWTEKKLLEEKRLQRVKDQEEKDSRRPLPNFRRLRKRTKGKLSYQDFCPPAPRNTTQFLIEEHSAGETAEPAVTASGLASADVGTHASAPQPITNQNLKQVAGGLLVASVDGWQTPDPTLDSVRNTIPYGFDQDFEAVMYEDMTREQLLTRVAQKDHEIDLLRARLRKLTGE